MRSALLNDAVAMILAGGQGERLLPLTRDRAKPAVPFGGAYRIIDITLSNCLNTGLSRIFILTQYRSVSLHRHVQAGWAGYFVPALDQFVDLVPPQQRTHSMWYRGTADAIYQNIYLLEQERPDRVLVLSGDHLYRMDYGEMIRHHMDSGATATVGCIEVPLDEARRFDVMEVDASDRVLSFEEKPSDPKALPGKPGVALASMGIYVFEIEVLVRCPYSDARSESAHDFGRDVLPGLVDSDEKVPLITQMRPRPWYTEHAYSGCTTGFSRSVSRLRRVTQWVKRQNKPYGWISTAR